MDSVADPRPHRIEIRVREASQLFNTMDPSPFNEKDLDADAEEYILTCAQEFPTRDPLVLIIHLAQGVQSPSLIEEAVRHYFLNRAKLTRLELRRLLRDARMSFIIGMSFLTLCLGASGLLASLQPGSLQTIGRESLTIAGWVAMWRPIQMCLYDWWPVRRRLRVFEKMSQIHVEVRQDS